MVSSLAWGALAASSLLLGALIGLLRRWPDRFVGAVLGFGAGALISAVSFDLAQEGVRVGGALYVALGLGCGALTYFWADRALDRRAARDSGTTTGPTTRDESSGGGTALALGAFLDGIPEQMVLGIGLGSGHGVSLGLLAAIFVSNLPESIGSATAMRAAGHPGSAIVRLWASVAVFCTLATVAGYAMAESTTGRLQAAINGFAAGALLVMLIDSMIPQAAKQAGRIAGLVTVLGFAVAAGLSALD